MVEEDPYFLELVRYIHLNPVRAGIVSDLHQLERYVDSGKTNWANPLSDTKIAQKGLLCGRRRKVAKVTSGPRFDVGGTIGYSETNTDSIDRLVVQVREKHLVIGLLLKHKNGSLDKLTGFLDMDRLAEELFAVLPTENARVAKWLN